MELFTKIILGFYGFLFLLLILSSSVQASYYIDKGDNQYLNFKTLANVIEEYEQQSISKNCYYNNYADLRDDMRDNRDEDKSVHVIKIYSWKLIKEDKPNCMEYRDINPMSIANKFNSDAMQYFNTGFNQIYQIKAKNK